MSTGTHTLDLANEAVPPADGILSCVTLRDDRIMAIVLGFGQGQGLSEHTAGKAGNAFLRDVRCQRWPER
jgi:hypothetical protein